MGFLKRRMSHIFNDLETVTLNPSVDVSNSDAIPVMF